MADPRARLRAIATVRALTAENIGRVTGYAARTVRAVLAGERQVPPTMIERLERWYHATGLGAVAAAGD